MYVILVYDTEKKNCAKLHKQLKKYLNWNQNSVFEGNLTEAQFKAVKILLEDIRVPESHITLYTVGNEKFLTREEIGEGRGNVSNII
jgi:CRISPR-associated protein Cas2